MKTRILTVLMLLATVVMGASAETFTEGGINYRALSENTVAVAKSTYSGALVIPATVSNNGVTYSVTEIGDSAFINCSGITELTLPEGLLKIGRRAFMGIGITELTLPESLETLLYFAFRECPNLTTVYYNPVKCETDNTGNPPFYKTTLTHVVISDKVQLLPKQLFGGQTALTEVTIPRSITSIASNAFLNCTGVTKLNYNATACVSQSTLSPFRSMPITEVNIGSNVVTLPEYVMTGIATLTTVNFSTSLKEIGDHAFDECGGLQSIELPASLTTIGKYAFNKTGLKSITIPEGIASIGYNAFGNCADLRHVTYNAANCTQPKLPSYQWFKGSPLSSYTLGSKVSTVPAYFMFEQEGIKGVDLPASITAIGANAFDGCNSITSVTIDERITSIDANAFANCASLKTVNFNAVNCTTPISQGNAIFYGSPIEEMNIGDKVEHIPNAFLYKQRKLHCITIPENVKSMGRYPFNYCENLRVVNFNAVNCEGPASGNYRWFDYTHLYELNLGDKVESIPNYLVYNQDSLKNFSMPESVKRIGDYAYYSCAQMQSIALPPAIEYIGAYAFSNCKEAYGDIMIPESLTMIGHMAFYNCSQIHYIYSMRKDATNLDNNPFGFEVQNTKWLIVPRGSAQSYKAATGWGSFRRMINDINGDDTIDIGDANMLINIILRGGDEETIKDADVNGSGQVDVSDSNVVISFMLGK